MEEKKNVFVYIRGTYGEEQDIIKYLKSLGGKFYPKACLKVPKGLAGLFFINSSGEIDCAYEGYDSYNWIRSHYEKISLPHEYEFEPFQKVLARDCSTSLWQADLYSHYDEDYMDDEDGSCYPAHICIGGAYDECLPFEGNEYLLGTTNPKEENK